MLSRPYKGHIKAIRTFLDSSGNKIWDYKEICNYEGLINELLETIRVKEGESLFYLRLMKRFSRAKTRSASLVPQIAPSQPFESQIADLQTKMKVEIQRLKGIRTEYSILEAAKHAAVASGFLEDVMGEYVTPPMYSAWKLHFMVPKAQLTAKAAKTDYDIAISYAGGDTAIARELAVKLRDSGFSVFYAGFETASLWGKNLHDYLIDLFSNRAKFTVLLLSEYYKKACGLD